MIACLNSFLTLDLERGGPLAAGGAVRRTGAGAWRVTAGRDVVESLVWEMRATAEPGCPRDRRAGVAAEAVPVCRCPR